MIRWAALLALVLLVPGVLGAQEVVKDSALTELIRSRGFVRGAETQLTKTLDLIKRIEVGSDGSVDTIYASDLVPDSAPAEWRVEEPEADSTSPPWVGDGRQLYQFWAWGDSSVAWVDAGGDTLRMTWTVPTDEWVHHIWPVFQRGNNLWVPSGDGWLPATIHPLRPWVCVDPAIEAESYSFTEKIVAAGIALGLKVAEWTIGVDSTFAKGLDRLPPTCPEPEPTEPPVDETGTPPMPTDISLAVYADAGDNGLLISWNPAPPGTDSVVVTGGPNDGPGATFARRLAGDAIDWREQPLTYDTTVTSVWACVRFKHGGVAGPNRCSSVTWDPL